VVRVGNSLTKAEVIGERDEDKKALTKLFPRSNLRLANQQKKLKFPSQTWAKAGKRMKERVERERRARMSRANLLSRKKGKTEVSEASERE